MSKTVTLTVVGENRMNCGGCERAVTSALRALPGVEGTSADHTTQRITVTLGSYGPPVERLQAELQEIGYQTEAR